MKFSRVLDRCIKILQMCEKSLYYKPGANGEILIFLILIIQYLLLFGP
jgi:hypothetical protein